MNSFLIKIAKLIYYTLNFYNYKYLNLNTRVLFNVRVQGKQYISLANGCVIQKHGWLLAAKIDENDPVLKIGKGTAVGDFCHIVSVREVIIEDFVLIANKVYISDNTHSYKDINTPIIFQEVKFVNKVKIGQGSWIGENVCIIGASVGKNSIIGANSLVTKDVPDYSIAVGSPARIIKQYNIDSKKWEKV